MLAVGRKEFDETVMANTAANTSSAKNMILSQTNLETKARLVCQKMLPSRHPPSFQNPHPPAAPSPRISSRLRHTGPHRRTQPTTSSNLNANDTTSSAMENASVENMTSDCGLIEPQNSDPRSPSTWKFLAIKQS